MKIFKKIRKSFEEIGADFSVEISCTFQGNLKKLRGKFQRKYNVILKTFRGICKVILKTSGEIPGKPGKNLLGIFKKSQKNFRKIDF